MFMSKSYWIFSLLIGILIMFPYNLFAKEFIYDSQGKRDPFFKVSEVKENNTIEYAETSLTPKQKLAKLGVFPSSIIYDENSPAILIGDEILEVGSTIKGVIIRAIEKDYVVFEIDGEITEYSLNEFADNE